MRASGSNTRAKPAAFWLSPAARRAVVAHARRDHPRECCGFLLGTGNRAVYACPMRNVAPGRTRYRIDDRAHIELRRILRAVVPPLSIVGVYHSHPAGPAMPSETDVREAWYPEWVHVIVGLAGRRPALRAFRVRAARVQSVRLR